MRMLYSNYEIWKVFHWDTLEQINGHFAPKFWLLNFGFIYVHWLCSSHVYGDNTSEIPGSLGYFWVRLWNGYHSWSAELVWKVRRTRIHICHWHRQKSEKIHKKKTFDKNLEILVKHFEIWTDKKLLYTHWKLL